ncbi:MAG TPA: hypothetical protein PLS87_11345 [Ferruginibacter sp.]|nr:hypothetical protein [Ferruginibacter sp.]HRO97462.1 hypothetical protein [Ferruginibacter sp.]
MSIEGFYIENARLSCCITPPIAVPPVDPEPEIPEEPDYNFDITGSWVSAGITDEASFIAFLESTLEVSNVTVEEFSLIDGRLRAIVAGDDFSFFYLDGVTATEVRIIAIEGVTTIDLQGQSLTSFNPIKALSAGLENLYLSNNDIASFDPTIALPSTLEELSLMSNELDVFNPTLPLPVSLRVLILNHNNLTAFNPTLPLPATLEELGLASNGITAFDPTNALPAALVWLDLSINALTTFDPTIALPSGLKTLGLGMNNLTEFNTTLPLPATLEDLGLGQNNLTSLNPTNPLPSTLTNLNLYENGLDSAAINTVLDYWNNTVNKTGTFVLYLGNQTTFESATGVGIKDASDLIAAGCNVILTTEYNFDVTADWSSNSVTDEASFVSHLESYSGVSGAHVIKFNLNSGRIRAMVYLAGTGITIGLNNKGVTDFKRFNMSGISQVNLQGNSLTVFNPEIALPSGMIWLNLRDNDLTAFNPTIALPSSLLILNLQGNVLTDFNPAVPLPTSISNVNISANELTVSAVNFVLEYFNTVDIKGSGFTLQLNNQTPAAAPTGDGITDKSDLIGRGATVTTD